MKKLILSFVFCLICFTAFCEQPFFLKNWIIPEDVEWGSTDQIPEIEGKTFSQVITEEEGFCQFLVGPTRTSNVEVPPYLAAHKLFDWNMTYSQILSAFDKSDDFKIFEYLNVNSSDYVSSITLSYDIMAITGKYQIEIGFPPYENDEQRASSLPVSFKIYYGAESNGYTRKEFFENEHRSEWNALSEDEKKIIALTCHDLAVFSDYDFCCTANTGDGRNAADVLSADYVINSKEELLSVLENSHQKKLINNYKNFLNILNSKPEKNPVEIGLELCLSKPEISRLFFVRNMAERLGPNGISVLDDINKLVVLRLGIGAGYLTYEEAMDIAVPIADKVLNSYSSYEDFFAHYIAGREFDNIQYNIHVLIASTDIVIYELTEYRLPVDEIKFSGKTENPLRIEYSLYNPSQDSMDMVWLRTFKISERKADVDEGLEIINSYIKTFNDKSLVEDLYQQIKTVQPDYSVIDDIINNQKEPYASVNMKKYYEENFKKYWDRLDDFEKDAVAFSSNIFQTNHMFHADFCNRIRFESYSSGKAILRNDWGITDYESLIECFNDLEQQGHNARYQEAVELVEKYPDKTPVEIGIEENLSIIGVTRLFYAKQKKDVLGKNGIRAWDDGRQIAIVRWGIGAGFISEEEAKELIAPVVKRIKESYVDFDDYIYHYIAGRGFFGLYDSSYQSRVDLAKYFYECSKAFIPFDEIKFTGNKENSKRLEYGAFRYFPSKEALEWEPIQNLSEEKQTQETLVKLKEYESSHPEVKSLVFLWHIELLLGNENPDYNEITSYFEDSFEYIEKLDHESETYIQLQIIYLLSLGYSGRSTEFYEYYLSLPDNVKENVRNYMN